MEVFYDEFFEDLMFGTPRKLAFNVDKTLDRKPTSWMETKTGYKGVCRTVGIAPEDVIVELKYGAIKVSGKTEYEGSKYDVSYEIPVAEDIISNVTEIKYKTLNGLTYIYLTVHKPEKKVLKAERIS